MSTTEESHTIGLLSIQIDNYEIMSSASYTQTAAFRVLNPSKGWLLSWIKSGNDIIILKELIIGTNAPS